MKNQYKYLLLLVLGLLCVACPSCKKNPDFTKGDYLYERNDFTPCERFGDLNVIWPEDMEVSDAQKAVVRNIVSNMVKVEGGTFMMGAQNNDPMLQIINQFRYRYELHPNVKLDKHEFKMIVNVVEGMREIDRLKLPNRRMLMTRLLEFFLRLLSLYRKNRLNEPHAGKRVSIQFHNNLAQHLRKHHDVGFYAEKACLSPKHFSTVVKQETGYTAAHWIHSQIMAEAKMLLHIRRNLSVRAIADMLGFDEQASFSRYFRREMRMSPSEFRDS